MTRLLLLSVTATVLAAATGGAQTSRADQLAASSVDYESFCKQDVATKKILLAKMEPDHCVALTLTQRQRWLDTNRPNLTPQQISAVQDWIKPCIAKK